MLILPIALPVLLASSLPSGSLPSHVGLDLAQARGAKTGRPLILVACRTAQERDQILAHLHGLKGVRLRDTFEICLPLLGDPATAALLDRLQLRSLPAVVHFRNASDASPVRSICGSEVPSLEEALERLRMTAGRATAEDIKAWAGPTIDPAPFLAFAAAREASLRAAAEEPHRAWLKDLVHHGSPELSAWAATRLCEAGLPRERMGEDPMKVILERAERTFRQAVLRGNEKSKEPLAPAQLGQTGLIEDGAPFWNLARNQLRASTKLLMSVQLYALLAPQLAEVDRDWILQQVRVSEPLKSPAHRTVVFWMALDWLLCFGTPGDWQAFQDAMPKAWHPSLEDVRARVKQIPAFWSAPPKIQQLFCGHLGEEDFWSNPDPCLESLGATRESLLTLGTNPLKVKKRIRGMTYPETARMSMISGSIHLRTLVDGNGRIQWLRPSPGYALWALAPSALTFGEGWTFEPAMVAGKPVPAQFGITINFKLQN